jgi:hypothetical protein
MAPATKPRKARIGAVCMANCMVRIPGRFDCVRSIVARRSVASIVQCGILADGGVGKRGGPLVLQRGPRLYQPPKLLALPTISAVGIVRRVAPWETPRKATPAARRTKTRTGGPAPADRSVIRAVDISRRRHNSGISHSSLSAVAAAGKPSGWMLARGMSGRSRVSRRILGRTVGRICQCLLCPHARPHPRRTTS